MDNMHPGGAQRVLVDLSNAMHAAGHDVTVIAGDGCMWAECHDVGRVILRDLEQTSATKLVPAVARLQRILRRIDPDVIDAHQRWPALLAQLATLGTRATVVEHVHALFEDRRLVSFRSRASIAVGSGVYAQLVDTLGRAADRTYLVQNGVAEPTARIGEPLRGSEIRLVGAGRLVSVKDPHLFGSIVHELRANGARVEGIWYGDGPLMPELRTAWPAVQWAGFSSDLATRLSAADALMITSLREGLPLVALESLALGRPILTRDVGSCRDAVTDGVNGLVWHHHADATTVARQLSQRLSLKDVDSARAVLRPMSVAARQRYEESFTLAAVVKRTLATYQEILE
jgi:glycosyltransferase involved in cell wall biosynthesis